MDGTAPGMEVCLYRRASAGGGTAPDLVRAGSGTSVRDGTAPGMEVGLYIRASARGGKAPDLVRAGRWTSVGKVSASGPRNDDDC
jgi:hypothetical protein